MIRALVVDDEELPRGQLCRMLAEHRDFAISEACDGVEALERIGDSRPDVLFLDIEMPELTGFQLLQHLADPPLTVFATAYDEYAIKAFEANAIDYLLKPVQAPRLAQTIDRIRYTLTQRNGLPQSVLRDLLIEMRQTPPNRIAVRKNKRIVLLPLRSVLWVGLEDRIVFVHTAQERFVCERTIGELENMLKSAGFHRVSRSGLVNLDHVREITPSSSGTVRLTLTNASELNVSRDRVHMLKQRIGV